MNTDLKAKLLDLKARQDAGEHMPCPRCGRDTMKPELHTNALSRHADVYVCDSCGTNEALLVMMGNPMPMSQWAFLAPQRPPSDLKALPYNEAVIQIQSQQIPFLLKLFKAWADNGRGDFEPYRLRAYEYCPGLTEIWEQPPQATFATREGRVLVRFKLLKEGIELAIDRLGK